MFQARNSKGRCHFRISGDANTASISGSTIGRDVYGGYASYANANSNAVGISGTTTTISGSVYGGFSAGGDATGNAVSIITVCRKTSPSG